jgi:outer membrane protein assembly factor BamD
MKYFYFLILFCTIFSCSEYQKILKNTDTNFQYEEAIKYYDNGDFARSIQLLEGLLDDFIGTSDAENVYYHYTYCYFFLKDYVSAVYHFNRFNNLFISSDKLEEMSFMYAYSHYLQSPRSSLDQNLTKEAIKNLELFIDTYPESNRIIRVNELILDLNKKIEKKNFEIVKLYYDTGKFKSAIFSIDNFLNNFPETELLEEVLYVQIQAYYRLAGNSIEEKKSQRVKEAIFAVDNFLISFPDGNFTSKVQVIYEKLKNIENGL